MIRSIRKGSTAMRSLWSKVGLSKHYLGTLYVRPEQKELVSGIDCKNYIASLLKDLGVVTLGEMLYTFENNSFSLLVNLAESHIAIHTWPERNIVQMDVFLCNYRHDNGQLCKQIYDKVADYFKPQKTDTKVVLRP